MYLGVECQYIDVDGNKRTSAIMAVNIGGYAFMMEPDEEEPIEISNVKPILRRLEDMTDKEINEVWHLEEPNAILAMSTGATQSKMKDLEEQLREKAEEVRYWKQRYEYAFAMACFLTGMIVGRIISDIM